MADTHVIEGIDGQVEFDGTTLTATTTTGSRTFPASEVSSIDWKPATETSPGSLTIHRTNGEDPAPITFAGPQQPRMEWLRGHLDSSAPAAPAVLGAGAATAVGDGTVVAARKNWILRHKILSAAAAVVAIIIIAVAASGGSSKKNTTDTAKVGSSVSSSAGPSVTATTVAPQSSAPPTAAKATTAPPAATVAPKTTAPPAVPTEYKNALAKASSYSGSTFHMSKQGVYDQLVSQYGEKFSAAAAQYAIDNVTADWNANALAKAKSYQGAPFNMSPSAIHDQLTSAYGEKFTQAEADYAIAHL